MRFWLAILLIMATAGSSRAANAERPAPKADESLGSQLLNDLAPEPQQPATPKPSAPAGAPTNGFGVGTNPALEPLCDVHHRMQNAEALLVRPGTNPNSGAVKLAGTVQQQVILDLDQLIAQLSKKCNGGQCQSGQCNGEKPCDKPGDQAKAGKPGSPKGSGKSAARDSTDRLNSTTAKPVDKGAVDEMAKALWGQLPERSREQMLQSFSDEFLPKYELEIEQYYRRLSEEQGAGQGK